MSGDFWIDADAVRGSAPAFNQLGDRMDQIFQALRGRMDEEGECWGGDDYGKAFEKDYLPARRNATEFFPQMSKGLSDIASGLIEAADTADRGEDATHQKFQT